MAERVADFHRLDSRLRLSGQLVARTALRIGSSGNSLDAVDLPVIKDAEGYPFIPGASLKGSLRSTVEALIRGAENRAATIWACDPLADEDNAFVSRGCGNHKREQRSNIDTEKHCAVCRLFGSQILASHVRFCDALLQLSSEDREHRQIPVETRDSVSIDRDLRRHANKRKYDFEVVSPGARFGIEVFVENPRPWLMGLLMMGFDQLAEGFTAIGGFTSRGLGRVDFAWSAITVVTAADLLNGKPEIRLEGSAATDRIRSWQQALSSRYRSGESADSPVLANSGDSIQTGGE